MFLTELIRYEKLQKYYKRSLENWNFLGCRISRDPIAY